MRNTAHGLCKVPRVETRSAPNPKSSTPKPFLSEVVVDLLKKQLTSPVLWEPSMQKMLEAGDRKAFPALLHCILQGLLGNRCKSGALKLYTKERPDVNSLPLISVFV